MSVQSTKLGPGRLTFGAAGTAQEFGAAITKASVVPESGDGEVITVLDGSEAIDAAEETWKLEGTIYQSYEADSLLFWCNEHAGEEIEFTYVPALAGKLQVSGRASIKSMAIGGDVKTRNTSDFSFKAVDVVVAPYVAV